MVLFCIVLIKGMVMLGKWKYRKLRSSTFHRPFAVNHVKQFFNWFVPFANTMHVCKRDCLIFVKWKNTGQKNALCTNTAKKLKGQPFYGEFWVWLEIFRKCLIWQRICKILVCSHTAILICNWKWWLQFNSK